MCCWQSSAAFRFESCLSNLLLVNWGYHVNRLFLYLESTRNLSFCSSHPLATKLSLKLTIPVCDALRFEVVFAFVRRFCAFRPFRSRGRLVVRPQAWFQIPKVFVCWAFLVWCPFHLSKSTHSYLGAWLRLLGCVTECPCGSDNTDLLAPDDSYWLWEWRKDLLSLFIIWYTASMKSVLHF